MDKERFAIGSTFQLLKYLLRGGVRIYTGGSSKYRSHSYMEPCVSLGSEVATQCLGNWNMVLCHYVYVIMHTAGERECLGDLVSRWVNAPRIEVRSVPVLVGSKLDKMISKDKCCMLGPFRNACTNWDAREPR